MKTLLEIWLEMIEEIEKPHMEYKSMIIDFLPRRKEDYEKDHDPKIAMQAFINAVKCKVPIPEWVLQALDECPKLEKYRLFPDKTKSEFLSLDELKDRWKVNNNFIIANRIFNDDLGYYVISSKWMSEVAQAAREEKTINYNGWTWVDAGEITFSKIHENLNDLAFSLEDVLEYENKQGHKAVVLESSVSDNAEVNKVLTYKDFIKNLRISYESDSEIIIQEPRKEPISYKHKQLGFRNQKKEWRTLLDILEGPDHVYHVNNEAERKRLKRISTKLIIKFFNKNYPVKIPDTFNLFELCPDERPGTYRPKFKTPEPNDIEASKDSKYINLSNDLLLNEIEKLGDKHRKIVEDSDRIEEEKVQKEINVAVGIALRRGIPDQDIKYYFKEDKIFNKENDKYDPYENEPSKPKDF